MSGALDAFPLRDSPLAGLLFTTVYLRRMGKVFRSRYSLSWSPIEISGSDSALPVRTGVTLSAVFFFSISTREAPTFLNCIVIRRYWARPSWRRVPDRSNSRRGTYTRPRRVLKYTQIPPIHTART